MRSRALLLRGVTSLRVLGLEVLHPVGLPDDRDEVGVVDEAVEDRARDRGVGEDLGPALEALVARDDEAAALVAARDDAVEGVGEHAVERGEAQLVEDDEVGLGEFGDPLLRGRVGHGGAERRGQVLDRREAHGAALLERLHAEADREVGLAGAGLADEDDVLLLLHEVAARERRDTCAKRNAAPELRLQAVRTLRGQQGSASRAALLSLLSDPHVAVREAVRREIVYRPPDEGPDLAKEIAALKAPKARVEGVRAVVARKEDATIFATDPDAEVRARARRGGLGEADADPVRRRFRQVGEVVGAGGPDVRAAKPPRSLRA